MANIDVAKDWLGNFRSNTLAWGVPHVVFILALLTPVPIRATVWVVALAWMGVACILNSRRCRRTHCRFTGPYYLAMTLPVLALGTGFISASFLGWVALAALILGGGKIIWWGTEHAWGQFS